MLQGYVSSRCFVFPFFCLFISSFVSVWSSRDSSETVRHGFAVLFMLVAVLAVAFNMSDQRNELSKPVSVLFGAR